VPNLAVEVVCPTDRVEDVHRKVDQYLESGIRLVWILWPQTHTVRIYVADETTRELGPDDTLDGGDVLPGFSVRVGELFEIPTRP
jgi:Uma2 family endonuclease